MENDEARLSQQDFTDSDMLHCDVSETWSDSSSASPCFAVQDSISAVKKEADRVNKVMIVSELTLAREEIRCLYRDVRIKSQELKKTSRLLKLKDARIASLVLERDLLLAESQRASMELQTAQFNARQQVVLKKSSPWGVTRVNDGLATDVSSTFPTARSTISNDFKADTRSDWRNEHVLSISFVEESLASPRVPSIGKMDDLSDKLRSSMATSAELRRRLASMSSYYEGLINELQSRAGVLDEESKCD